MAYDLIKNELHPQKVALERTKLMNDDSRPTLTADDIFVLAKAARLTLGTGRADLVAPALDGVMQSFDALDEVDLGETPPTNAFDPRWRT